MRKTSHDGGDSTSITSGVENETKKSAMKPKKSSLKRKVPSFSQESDDTVIEPLLQKDKEKPVLQSAKYFGIVKTDSSQNKESDNKAKTTTTTGFCGTTESLLSFKDSETAKSTTSAVAPLHNYMNTNVFNTYDNIKANITTKSQILVEIDSSKQSSYTPSPLIFTTAKIHTDSKTKNMEPVHVTPVPILSTIEVSISKGKNGTTNERKISNGSSVINPVYSPLPLSKGKEVKVTVSNFSTVISPTINKDAFSKAVIVTSANKSANVTVAQGSSMKIILPSTAANSSFLTKNNAKDKQGVTKDVNKEQTLQLQSKTSSADGTKNDARVKPITPSSGKVIDISTTLTKTSQDDKSQVQKLNAVDDIQTNLSANVSSCNSQKFISNDKTLTSELPTGISNPTKNIPSSVGNKHLQRQKPAIEDTSNIKSKVDPNIERSENLSAKMSSSSHSKIIDSEFNKHIPSNINANNTQTINTKSDINDTAKEISKITSSSTTTKPTVTNLALSNTITAPIDVSSKHSSTSTIPNADKIIFPTTTSSTMNKISAASTNTPSTVTKSPPQKTQSVLTTVTVPTSISKAKSPDLSSMQTQSQTSNCKTLHDKKPVLNATTVKTTTLANSGKSKAANTTTAKSPPAVTATAEPKSTQNSTISKASAITTSVKGIPSSSVTSVSTKPSTSTSQAISSKTSVTSSSVAVVQAEALTTLNSKIILNAVTAMTTSPQNITTTQGDVNKHATTVSGAITKTSSAVTPVKPSTVNSSAPALSTVKSPNNNSSNMFEVPKPSTVSIPKTESMPTSSKTSSTNVNAASIVRSPKGTSAATMITKESATSEEKSEASKISVFANSPPVTAANKSIVGKTTKTSSEVSSVPISAVKKSGTAVFTKTGSVTTSTKSPSASTLTKAPEVSSSSTTASTVAFNPATTTVTQVSANKSVGLAGSSVPSSTPVLRQPELVQKGGSKSSENNKDSKSSKA